MGANGFHMAPNRRAMVEIRLNPMEPARIAFNSFIRFEALFFFGTFFFKLFFETFFFKHFFLNILLDQVILLVQLVVIYPSMFRKSACIADDTIGAQRR